MKLRGFHHDLKPQNILVFADDDDKDRVPSLTEFVLTISDFGAAKIKLIISHSQSGIEDSYKQIEFVRGDPVYSAPDHILEQKTSRPYDIWSLGCVFWRFCFGSSTLVISIRVSLNLNAKSHTTARAQSSGTKSRKAV